MRLRCVTLVIKKPLGGASWPRRGGPETGNHLCQTLYLCCLCSSSFFAKFSCSKYADFSLVSAFIILTISSTKKIYFLFLLSLSVLRGESKSLCLHFRSVKSSQSDLGTSAVVLGFSRTVTLVSSTLPLDGTEKEVKNAQRATPERSRSRALLHHGLRAKLLAHHTRSRWSQSEIGHPRGPRSSTALSSAASERPRSSNEQPKSTRPAGDGAGTAKRQIPTGKETH